MMTFEIGGVCPACGRASLHVDSAAVSGQPGVIRCHATGCPRPEAAAAVLAGSATHHVVDFGPKHFAVTHPLIERLDGAMIRCSLDGWLGSLNGPPLEGTGIYRAAYHPGWDMWDFTKITTEEIRNDGTQD